MLHSLDPDEAIKFSVGDPRKNAKHWGEYPKAVAWALRETGHVLLGWEGVAAGGLGIPADERSGGLQWLPIGPVPAATKLSEDYGQGLHFTGAFVGLCL